MDCFVDANPGKFHCWRDGPSEQLNIPRIAKGRLIPALRRSGMTAQRLAHQRRCTSAGSPVGWIGNEARGKRIRRGMRPVTMRTRQDAECGEGVEIVVT